MTTNTAKTEIDARTRRHLLAGGIFFILTFLFSIPAVLLYDPLLSEPNYVLGGGSDTRITWGVLLEVGLIFVNAATAIALFPVLKRVSESVALGYVGVRIFESVMIAIGAMSLLSVLTLRQDLAGTADAASLTTAAASLIALHDWTFLFGPAFCASIGNGVLLGFLMYKSGYIPKRVALLGLIGGPLAFVNPVGVLFGGWDQMSEVGLLLTSVEIVWEATFGIWMTVIGLAGRTRTVRPSVAAAGSAVRTTN